MFGDILRKVGGGAVATAGKILRLPEMGYSERIATPLVKGASTQKAPSSPRVSTTPTLQYVNGGQNYPAVGTSNNPYSPATGGQAAGSGGGSGDGSQSFDFAQPQGDSGDQNYVNELRNAFGGLRSSIEGMIPGLESTYNTVKADIEGGINRAKETFGERKQDIEKGFGTNLKSLLQSDRELGERNRNVYSGLNALDSSSYGDAEIKRSQSVFDTQAQLTGDKERQLREGERELQQYESEANKVLAQAGSEYMQQKSALQQALAQNDLNSATAIQNAMNETRARAQQAQDTVNAFKLNLAQLQAQGVNVAGNLSKLGSGSLNNILSGYQTNTLNPSLARLVLPQAGVQGSGYIGGSSAEDKKRLSMMA